MYALQESVEMHTEHFGARSKPFLVLFFFLIFILGFVWQQPRSEYLLNRKMYYTRPTATRRRCLLCGRICAPSAAHMETFFIFIKK